MEKLTKANIEKLAYEIKDYLVERDISGDVSIFYNNKRMSGIDDNGFVITENADPHKFFECAAYNHILSMAFDGALYDYINRYINRTEEVDGFNEIFEEYGLYYELGNSWNLTAYPIDDDIQISYTVYKKPDEPIRLIRWKYNAPSEIQTIMEKWFRLSELEGDKGSCVLGAHFAFDLNGKSYIMPEQSPWQGSLSWESNIDVIRKDLGNVGATNITYDYGRMD